MAALGLFEASMQSIVCVKEIPDPLGIAQLAQRDELRVAPPSTSLAPGQGVSQVMSPFDEQAVEAALRLKDRHGGGVTALSMGPPSGAAFLRHALAMGVDEGVVLCDPAFDNADGYATAAALAAAIAKIGAFDLVLCGRQSADMDNGEVGPFLAEMLGLPCVTLAKDVEAVEGAMRVIRVLTDGFEIVESPLPAVVTVSNELGAPRYPALAGIMRASRKHVAVWGLAELDLPPSRVGSSGARVRMVELSIPRRTGMCEFVTGETPADAGRGLALTLRRHGLI